jgi:hypothetical protein
LRYLHTPALLPAKDQDRISKMIDMLGLNFYPIRELRRMYFARIWAGVRQDRFKLEDITVDQFPTAFEMIKMENGVA